MRSRYTAYVLQNENYLLRTWHPSTRPTGLFFDQQPAKKWLGLKVIASHAGQQKDKNGTVEFIARFTINGKASRLQELSQFVKENQRWLYVDGEMSK